MKQRLPSAGLRKTITLYPEKRYGRKSVQELIMSLFPKLKLSPRLIRFAYHFVDLEASGDKDRPVTRVIEYSFVIQKLGSAQGEKLLDIGCTSRWNLLPATLVGLGWKVYGIDIRELKFRHPNFHFVCGDVRNTSFPDNFFDCVCAISTIEHIGLSGRYGVAKEDPKGDVKAIKEVERIIHPGGTFPVTVPYGQRLLSVPSIRFMIRLG